MAPSWREVELLPLEQKLARMRDPEFRRRLLSESPEGPQPFFKSIVSDLEAMFGDPPNYDLVQGRCHRLGHLARHPFGEWRPPARKSALRTEARPPGADAKGRARLRE
jgi:hypothetical protein